MSRTLLDAYTRARRAQEVRNEARHIRAKVHEARGSPHDAAVRWPFELLQNAVDAGPRSGRSTVDVILRQNAAGLVFEHDGALFKVQELAALLSGGSSKEFDDIETTGRFGTGFLVTHVLASRVRLAGLLESDGQIEQFDLLLDRSGDEDSIVQNIEHCNSSIESAQVMSDPTGLPSAQFMYGADDVVSLRQGIEAFRQALPYLFATCPRLGNVTLELDGEGSETWRASPLKEQSRANATIARRIVRIEDDGTEYCAVRVASAGGASAAAVVLERSNSGWQLLRMPAELPRVFCRYPIRSTSALRLNVVLDGPFDLDQERRRILFGSDATKAAFRSALAAVVPLADLAWSDRWTGRHLLAKVGRSNGALSDQVVETEWVDAELRTLADALARMALVETPKGFGPAMSTGLGWYADFISPRLSAGSESDDIAMARVWDLVADANTYTPPLREIAEDWSEIVSGWIDLGVEIALVNLGNLARSVREEAKTLDDLRVRCDARDWLARFTDCVGECWSRRGVTTDILDGLLPDQHERLAAASELRREGGIPAELKDIAEAIGFDVRRQLLDAELARRIASADLRYAADAVAGLLATELSSNEVIESCVNELRNAVPDESDLGESGDLILSGSIRFLDYLWRKDGKQAAHTAKQVPILSSGRRWVEIRSAPLMSPPGSWPAEAAPFVEVYPPQRVLADEYRGDGSLVPNVVPHLVAWGMAHAGPLISRPVGGADFKVERIRRILLDQTAALEGVVLAPTEFSDLALLHEIVPRCAEDADLAKSLLALVLRFLAPSDSSWETPRLVRAHRGRDAIQLEVRPALWLADLLSRPWIPIRGKDGVRAVTPDAHAIRPLLNPRWYEENDAAIRLLVGFFGFDALELRLAGVGDEEIRGRITDELARMVTILGGDIQGYGEVASQLEARERLERQRERFRKLGRAVQDAVEATLKELGMHVRVVDIGYDFEVSEANLETPSYRLALGSALVEVKATTLDRVRMTPKQASTSATNADKYVLCVVDLGGVPEERLDQPWSTADILQRAKITTDIGGQVRSTWRLVEEARSEPVPIAGDAALRYEVPADIWGRGCGITDWIASRRADLETAPELTLELGSGAVSANRAVDE